jgi:predicted TIM-barrel fold metal-dependent hydrolase
VTVVDADGHVEEDLRSIVERLPDAMRALAPTFRREDDGTITNLIEGRPWRPEFAFPRGRDTHTSAGGAVRTGGRDPRERLAVLDSEGIDVAVLFPSLGLMFGLYEDPAAAAALCAAGNDWVADYCATDPRRLAGVATLPQQDPAVAVTELERCVDRHDFVAGMIRPNRIGGRTVDDADFDVLWSAAEALDVPIVCHEAYVGSGIDTVGLDRISSYAGAHIISHPLEQMMAMLGITLSGVLVRHPRLRLGFFEAGCSWAPYWVERIEEHFELAPADYAGGDPHGVLPARTWLTFELDEAGVEFAAACGWAANLCFASDYPHFDATFPGAVDAVRARDFEPGLEAALLSDNALRFYGERLARRM